MAAFSEPCWQSTVLFNHQHLSIVILINCQQQLLVQARERVAPLHGQHGVVATGDKSLHDVRSSARPNGATATTKQLDHDLAGRFPEMMMCLHSMQQG